MNATVEFVSRFGSLGSIDSTGRGGGFEDLRDLVGRDVVGFERGTDAVGDHRVVDRGRERIGRVTLGEQALTVDQDGVERAVLETGLGGGAIGHRLRPDRHAL